MTLMRLSFRRLLALSLLASLPLAAEVRSLTILHTNDVHAHISPSEQKLGGFAYLAAAIAKERANCPQCILLNAGDLVQGTPVSTIFHGLPIYELANLFGYDAATLGNHEFDYGWMQVRKFMETAKYPVVSSNLVDNAGRLFTKDPYVILNVNGLRVGVLGALTDDMKNLSTPKLMGEWHTAPVVGAVRKYAAELREKCDIVVLLAHIDDNEEAAFLQYPELPVIVTGHIHTGIPQAMTKDGRVLVRVKGYGEELGRLDLQIDTVKKAPVSFAWKKIVVDANAIKPDAAMAAEVKKWEDEAAKRVDAPMAITKRALAKPEIKALMEQAMREETGANFAFMNSGGVRDTLPQGQLRERHIWNIMPFDNRVVVGRFKGSQIPAVVLNGKSVDPNKEYTLAVSDFTAANQGDNSQLRSTGLQFPDDVGLLRDLLIDWFRKKGTIE
jgi:2',3'-cyclic-nucleotide 2'-phosphodiesterase (5'-nucleotidase family)